jgi:hypothetical protein
MREVPPAFCRRQTGDDRDVRKRGALTDESLSSTIGRGKSRLPSAEGRQAMTEMSECGRSISFTDNTRFSAENRQFIPFSI